MSAISADGRWAALGVPGGNVVVIELASGQEAYTLPPEGSDIWCLAWSADGYVYTVISDAPASTVAQAVRRLPHDSPPGFWDRIGRGLHRIMSWANPFR